MARLILETGPERGKYFQLPHQGAFGIGRDPKCAVHIDDKMASRIHCVVRCEGDRWILENRKSLNGTRVNGQSVDTHELAAGDSIEIGDTLLSVAASDSDPMIGRTVAGYRIERRLGRGAMGTVYLAQQLSLDRPVALKILAPRFARDVAFIRRFIDEARAAARLNHPNVVQVYDAGDEGDCHFMSMEFLEGGSLEDVIQEQGRLDPDEAVQVARDAALALGFAEQNRIVHRDIKPANLMIAADGTVKVGDLGIAADLSGFSAHNGGADQGGAGQGGAGQGGAGGGKTLQAAGSPRYMAPEQAKGGPVDYRADIYALGATLYRMIAGQPPFDGASVSEIVQAKLESDPVPLRERVPEVSAVLSAVVEKMMARDPAERYASATEVFAALDPEQLRRGGGQVRRTVRVRGASRSVRAAAGRAAAGRAAVARAGGARVAGGRSGRRSRPASVPRLVGAGIIGIVVLVLALIVISQIGRGRSSGDTESTSRDSTKSSAPRERAAAETLDGDRSPSVLDRDRSRIALTELRRIESEFRAGRLAASDAQGQLATLFGDHPRVRPTAEAFVAELEQAVAREPRRAIAAGASATETDAGAPEVPAIDALIGRGELIAAAGFLDEFERRHPGAGADDIRARRQELASACRALIDGARQPLAEALARGEIDAARAQLSALEPRLPAAYRSALAALAEDIDRALLAREKLDLAVEAIAPLVRRRVAILDFDGATAALADVAGAAAGGTTSAATAASAGGGERVAALREEVDAARAAWTALSARVDALARQRGIQELAFEPALPAPLAERATAADRATDGRYRLLSRYGAALRIAGASSKARPRVIALLSLAGAELSKLVAAGNAGAAEAAGGSDAAGSDASSAAADRAALRRGLGILCLLRHGPERARGFLLADDLPPSERARNDALVVAVGATWRAHWLEATQALEAEVAAGETPASGAAAGGAAAGGAAAGGAAAGGAAAGGATASVAVRGDLWNHVADEAGLLLVSWRDPSAAASAEREASRATLRALYVAAREAALALLPPETFFHAADVRRDGSGLTMLSYDFSDGDQALDFVPVQAGIGALEWFDKRRLLKLSGEVRFLTGDPFRERIGVTAIVPKAAYSSDSPNINVALWTRAEDRITPLSDGRRIDFDAWRPGIAPDDQVPADYFVAGVGYLYEFDLSSLGRGPGARRGPGRGGLTGFLENLLPGYLREPSLALLSGARGRSLHHTRKEVIWESPAATVLRGAPPVKVTVQIFGPEIGWRINNKPLNVQSSRELDRLKTNAPHSGSLSLFTNGSNVHFSSIEVFGELDPEWTAKRARAIAAEELAKLDPDAATTANASPNGAAPGQ